MRRAFRWLFRIFLVVVVLAVALVLLKDILLKALAERRIRQQTGLEVTIQRLEVGLLTPVFHLEGLKLYNAPDFGGSVLLDIPEIHLEYDATDATAGIVHLRRARLNIAELHVVRNRSGQTNLIAILERVRGRPTTTAPRPPSGGGAPPPAHSAFAGIDLLYLTVGKLRLTDLQRPANNQVFSINWKDRETRNLKSATDAQALLYRIVIDQLTKNPDALKQLAPLLR